MPILGQGITIKLLERTQTGADAFNRPIYTETATEVENVLVGEPSTEEITTELNLSGKRLAYTLAIPKGDTHTWEDHRVEIRGEIYEVLGKPTEGIDHLIPLDWNKKVKVAQYG